MKNFLQSGFFALLFTLSFSALNAQEYLNAAEVQSILQTEVSNILEEIGPDATIDRNSQEYEFKKHQVSTYRIADRLIAQGQTDIDQVLSAAIAGNFDLELKGLPIAEERLVGHALKVREIMVERVTVR